MQQVNALISYFLVRFGEGTHFSVRQKARLFAITGLLSMFSVAVVTVMQTIAGTNGVFSLSSNATFFTASVGCLLLLRDGRLMLAINAYLLAFCVLVAGANLPSDWFTTEPRHFLRMMETLFNVTIILFLASIFALRTYQLWLTFGMSLLLVWLHYFILIEKHHGGQYTTDSLLALSVYSFMLLVVALIAYFAYVTKERLTGIIEHEADHVRELNQQLEHKVRERTQQLESQNNQLSKVNGELDHFVYRVSHDLRTPLASVLGLIALIKLEDDPDAVRHYVDLQEESVTRLDSFIQDIINVSRNARREVLPAVIDWPTLVNEVFAGQATHPRAAAVEQTLEMAHPFAFYTDPERLKIILGHLVANGICYSKPASARPFVRVRVRQAAIGIGVEVEDNGIGIGAAHLDKVFDLFYRATSDYAGAGLGLYIVKELVEKLGGTIGVESALGQGTRFVLTLPCLSVRPTGVPSAGGAESQPAALPVAAKP